MQPNELDALRRLDLTLEGRCLLAPCVEVCLYFYRTPTALIYDFAKQAKAALDGDLKRYLTGSMRRAAKRGAKSEATFLAMFEGVRPGKQYWMVLRGGTDEGTHAAELSIGHYPPGPPPSTDEEIAAAVEYNRKMFEEYNSIFSPFITQIRATFPLDHALAEADALKAWVLGLDCVQAEDFVSGHVGYALNMDEAVASNALRQRAVAPAGEALLQHSGLGYDVPGDVGRHLLKYWPGHADFLPRIRRVQWLTLVQRQMLDELCGGQDAVRARLQEHPGVEMIGLGGSTRPDAFMIQAGDAPHPGGTGKEDTLSAYRAVARVLAPRSPAQGDVLRQQCAWQRNRCGVDWRS